MPSVGSAAIPGGTVVFHAAVNRGVTANSSDELRVAAGHGVTFISRTAIEADVAAGMIATARVRGLDPAREIFLVRSTGRAQTRAAQSFVDFARARLPA